MNSLANKILNIGKRILGFALVLGQILSTNSLYAQSQDINNAISRLDRNQLFTYGPQYLVQSVFNAAAERNSLDAVRAKQAIEDRNKKKFSKKEASFTIRGPMGGGESKNSLPEKDTISIDDYNTLKEILYDPANHKDIFDQIMADLEVWLRNHGSNFMNRTNYDENLDFNNDGFVTISDELMARNRDGRVIPKILKAVEQRIGIVADENSYIPIFDLEKNDGFSKLGTDSYQYGSNPEIREIKNIWDKIYGDKIGPDKFDLRMKHPSIYSTAKETSLHNPISTYMYEDLGGVAEPGKGDAGNLETEKDQTSFGLKDSDADNSIKGPGLEDKTKNPEQQARSISEEADNIIIDKDYLDKDTRRHFEDAVYFLKMVETMRDAMEGIDFNLIKDALCELRGGYAAIYYRYISDTEHIYKEIAALLKIDVQKDILPDGYYIMPMQLSEKERMKILVDIKIKALTEEGVVLSSPAEKEAVDKYKNRLAPIQKGYKEDMGSLLELFSFKINKAMMNVTPASVSNDDGKFSGLFTINCVEQDKPAL